MGYRAFAFFLSFLGSSSFSFSYTTKELIETIQTQKLTNVDQVVAALPAELRSQYTLQYKGAGLQAASFDKPRVIAFSADGKFVVTFNSDESQAMGNDLEILEFNDTKNEFELYQISFEAGQLKSGSGLANPAQCLGCHSSSKSLSPKPFPIWGRYPSWSGAYGSNEDRIFGKELNPFLDFESKRKEHARYSHLLPPKGSPVSPFSTESVQTVTFRPNGNLGSLLARLNAKALAHQFQTEAKTRAEQEALVKNLLLLSPSFFNCKKQLSGNTLNSLDIKLSQSFLQKGFINKPFSEKAYYDLENLAYLMGSSTYAFGQVSYGKKFTSPYFLDGYFMTTPNYLISELAAVFFSKYPSLKKHYEPLSVFERAKNNPRLVKTDLDRSILKSIDSLVQPLFLKEDSCKEFNQILKMEWQI